MVRVFSNGADRSVRPENGRLPFSRTIVFGAAALVAAGGLAGLGGAGAIAQDRDDPPVLTSESSPRDREREPRGFESRAYEDRAYEDRSLSRSAVQPSDESGIASLLRSTGCFVRNIFVSDENCGSLGMTQRLPPTDVTQAQGLEDVHVRAAGWRGDPQYQYILGYMFETGELVDENAAGALVWYTLAAAQGHRGAREARRRLIEDAYIRERRDDRNDPYLYRDDIEQAELRVHEIFRYGGKDAHYRMAQIFFDPAAELGTPGVIFVRNYVEAYAWACLAEFGKHREAADFRAHLEGGAPGQPPFLEAHELTIANAICENYRSDVYTGERLFEISPADMEMALTEGPEFQERRAQVPSSGDQARAYLNAGRAELARGNIKKARINFQKAIVADGLSQAGMEAQRQLTALTTTCSVPTHYAGVDGHPLTAVNEEISLEMRQRGLRALGLYQGAIDGRPGPRTRRAIEEFQEILNVDRTGDLAPRETVELICKSAQIHRDPVLMNMLGFMYYHGIGFEKDFGAALHWFREAGEQNNASALYNLGRMYERGDGVTASVDMASQYFYEAKKFGHPKAHQARTALCSQGGCR